MRAVTATWRGRSLGNTGVDRVAAETLARWSGQVEDDSDGLAQLRQHGCADVSSDAEYAPWREAPDVLTLDGGGRVEPVHGIRFDDHLGVEVANGAGDRHHVDNGWLGIEDPLGGDDDGRMTEAGLASLGSAQIEIDNVTRGQHRAR